MNERRNLLSSSKNNRIVESTLTDASLAEEEVQRPVDYVQQRNRSEEPEQEPTMNELIAATRLTRDLKRAAALLSDEQARYLVDLYYALQKSRIGAAAMARASMEAGEPNDLISHTETMYQMLENDMKSALGIYAQSKVPGKWAMSITGIGPVIAAGLLAHINIAKTPSSSALISFAGCSPNSIWLGKDKSAALVKEILGPGKQKEILTDEQIVAVAEAAHRTAKNLYMQARDEDGDVTRAKLIATLARRPWNAKLKSLVIYKAGESFIKSSGSEKSFYGPIYRERKLFEMEQNNQYAYATQAKNVLYEKNIGEDTGAYEAYNSGMLPPAHIHARARRYTVKIFLYHYYAVLFEHTYGKPAPLPYVISQLGHQDYIPVPNWANGDVAA